MKIDKDIIWMAIIAVLISGNLIQAIMINNVLTKEETPYEQTYDYLFNRVDNYPNHIIRTTYYGRDYFTVPVETECGIEDYVMIHQDCKLNIVKELSEEEKE